MSAGPPIAEAVTTRPARPEDAPFVAWVMQAAARSHLERGMWDLVFPDDEDERLGFMAAVARSESPSFCSWRGFRIAEVAGTPAAALSAYVPARAPMTGFVSALRGALVAAGWSEEQMLELLPRFGPFERCQIELPDEAWVVEWVATRPEFRKRGLVRRLLCEILAEGRAAGHETAAIGILLGNEPAQRAYEQVGFRMHAERRSEELARALGTPGLAQLRLDLRAWSP